jgi:hypothetical protein
MKKEKRRSQRRLRQTESRTKYGYRVGETRVQFNPGRVWNVAQGFHRDQFGLLRSAIRAY